MLFGQRQAVPCPASLAHALSLQLLGAEFFICACLLRGTALPFTPSTFQQRWFVDKPLLALSPNKTFEGFLGAIVWTCGFAFYFSGHVASFKWMTCPATALTW